MYDLEKIIDKEGVNGLNSIFKELHDQSYIDPMTSHIYRVRRAVVRRYIKSRVDETVKRLGLSSLTEADHEDFAHETVKERFSRKEAYFADLKADYRLIEENLDVGEEVKSQDHVQRRSLLCLGAYDYLIDIRALEHELQFLEQTDKAGKTPEAPSDAASSFATSLKSYANNLSYWTHTQTDLRVTNESINSLARSHLDNLINSYFFFDGSTREEFIERADRIVENKRLSYLSMWEEGNDDGGATLDSIIAGAGFVTGLVVALGVMVPAVIFAVKGEAPFYSEKGLAAGVVYLGGMGIVRMVRAMENYISKLDRRVLNENEALLCKMERENSLV